jgi:DNA-binding response OmpR family regulator
MLVVDRDAQFIKQITDLASSFQCRVLHAPSAKEAKIILSREKIDLLLTESNLPDADGLSLVAALHKRDATAAALLTGSSPTGDEILAAVRAGVADFLPKPIAPAQLALRLKQAFRKHDAAVKVERRIDRLTGAVKRLSEARRQVGKKVDLLCNDLVAAYGELTRQMDSVRIQEDFRKCLAETHDLEQLLCHAMDWIMRHLGYSNFAIWLAADDANYELGAYIKYTIASDENMIASMKEGILQQALRHGTVHLSGAEARNHLAASELTFLAGQTVLASTACYLGESLAGIVLFRDENSPYTADDVATLQSVAPIFAIALAAAVRSPGAENADVSERDDEKDDSSDWWKTGGAPPF